MYEQFGAAEVGDTGVAEFRVFFPDATLDPTQYSAGGLPRVTRIRAVGTFQATAWDIDTGVELTAAPYLGQGRLWSGRTAALAPAFYEYKYYVEFDNADPRWVSDPCTTYGGSSRQRAGFVIDQRADVVVTPLGRRPPLEELLIYEIMIDDFTAEFRGTRAPLDAISDKVRYLADLGVNAVELMPWTAWPGDAFDWGYEPYAYFSVAHRYTLDPAEPTQKLSYLKQFISACHQAGIAVIMDGVFDHVQTQLDGGFAYAHLYGNPDDCPFTGNFEAHDYGTDLNYANRCTLAFVLDVLPLLGHRLRHRWLPPRRHLRILRSRRCLTGLVGAARRARRGSRQNRRWRELQHDARAHLGLRLRRRHEQGRRDQLLVLSAVLVDVEHGPALGRDRPRLDADVERLVSVRRGPPRDGLHREP